MSKPRIMIDAGHGGTDPGACGNGVKEKDLTLKISKYQEKRFKELGFTVGMTRTSDTYIGLTNRGNMMKNFNADICLCNHINAASNPSATGAEIITSIYSDGKLANNILDKLVGAGAKRRRVYSRESTKNKGNDYYTVHASSGNTAVQLIEYGFLSNPGEAKFLQDNWQKYAEAVVIAVCNYYNVDLNTNVKEEKPVITKDHWAEEPFKELTEDYKVKIHEKRFNDNITRGEAFALQLAVIKAIKG